ncbi:MAG: LPS export ABC transporter periplasmic protein LptC [Chitinophagales bacterium]
MNNERLINHKNRMFFKKKTSPINTHPSFILFILLVFLIILQTSCEQVPLAKIKAMFDEKDADVEVADSVKFTYKEGEYARAVVTAPKVKRYTKEQSKLEFSNGLLVRFYEALDMISVLKADYGVNDDAKQLIITSGNVHMENAKNEIMETQELTWNIKTKKVWTDKAIRIKTPDNIINGIGFDADEDFSNYTIRKVTGVVAVDDDKGFKE